MINRKIFKYLFLSLILNLVYCCGPDTTNLSFEKQRITSKMVMECSTDPCARIEINILHCLSDNGIAQKIDQEIEQFSCRILQVSDSKPFRDLESAISAFNLFYQEMKSQYPEESLPYEVSIDYEISFQNKEFVSIVVDHYIFTGGAHGYGAVSFLNLDKKTGKSLSTNLLLKDYQGFTEYVEKKFRKANGIDNTASINSTGFFFENEKFSLPERLGFSEEEVILVYAQYDIGAYSNDPWELRLKKPDVASFFAIPIQ